MVENCERQAQLDDNYRVSGESLAQNAFEFELGLNDAQDFSRLCTYFYRASMFAAICISTSTSKSISAIFIFHN